MSFDTSNTLQAGQSSHFCQYCSYLHHHGPYKLPLVSGRRNGQGNGRGKCHQQSSSLPDRLICPDDKLLIMSQHKLDNFIRLHNFMQPQPPPPPPRPPPPPPPLLPS